MGLQQFWFVVVAVLFLGFFLASAGNTFRRKLVKSAGTSLTQKKLTVQALDEISDQVQRYLLVQLLLSAVVGVATGIFGKKVCITSGGAGSASGNASSPCPSMV